MSSTHRENRGICYMDQSSVTHLVEEFADVIQSLLTVKKVVLFGSYARGTPRKDSDIDVAVVTDSLDADYLTLWAELARVGGTCRIEAVLLELGKDRSGFLREILRSGKIIYDSDAKQENPT
jgi:uncharacterized protein